MKYLICFISLFLSMSSYGFNDEEIARKLGLDTGLIGQPWTFLGTHSVFVNDDFSRQMMVMRNVTGQISGIQFLEAEGYLIVNIPESKETLTSVALVGITREMILPYLQRTSFSIKNLLPISLAHANDCAPSGAASIPGLTQLTDFFTTGPGAGFARCVMNFAQGAWSATGGAVGDFIEGAVNLVREPRAFWNRRVQQMRNMWQFVSHFRSSMSQVIQNVRNLPQETINQMMCAFLGGVGAGAAVTLLTGGAGIGPLLLRVTAYATKLAGLSRTLSLLSSLNKLDQIPSRFYEGIASGRVTERAIDRVDSFARNRMDSMVEGAIRCAI